MLKMTPQFAKALRRAARREQERFKGRLGQARFAAIRAELVAVIRLAFAAGATGSLFGLEGPLCAAIRSDLCLQGWRWRDANDMAKLLLSEAFFVVGAERPSWAEGQPEWVISAGNLIERTRCANCHGPLPEERPKFCSDLCKNAHGLRVMRLREAQEDTALDMAVKSPL
jgi:mono/diheme cytochrome c family protein